RRRRAARPGGRAVRECRDRRARDEIDGGALAAVRAMSDTAPARRLSLVDCVGIGINGIIGSGIFLLPARVYAQAGGLSWAAWFAVGGICLLVGLCFGEVASMTSRNGGPYAYARDAFGEPIAFAVGWMSVVSILFGYGAVARALGRNLSYVVPALSSSVAQAGLAVAIIGVLAALNWRGIKL